MEGIKECAVCGTSCEIHDVKNTTKLLTPHSLEEKYYYDLWHKNVEECPHCGYVSFDISVVKNKDVVNNEKYLNSLNNILIKELKEIKQNRLEELIKCGCYYNISNNPFFEAISYLQASDEIFKVVNYLNDYIFDNTNLSGKNENQKIENRYVEFADTLFLYALSVLKKIYSKDNKNIEVSIVYGGALLDGNQQQANLGRNILEKALQFPLSAIQRKTILFLLEN